MAFNGAGVFQRLYNWTNDANANIKIRSDRMDNEDNGFATGLSTCITKDGQTTITANLPMAGFIHTGVGNGTARNHYAAIGQVQDDGFTWGGTAGGTANAITANLTPAVTVLVAGLRIRFIAASPNSAATTFSPNGLAAKAVTKQGANALVGGEILAGMIIDVEYDGTQWQILNPAGTDAASLSGNNTFSGDNTFTGKINTPSDGTLTIASGVITITGAYHLVDTEAAAALDQLDTINGFVSGERLTLRTANDARDVIITNAGNIITPTGANISLLSTANTISLIYDGGLSKWIVESAAVLPDLPISAFKDKVLNGLLLANNATDAVNDIDISAGSCVSDDGTTVMTLATSYTKQLDASWAVGTNAGGRDTGSIADNTWHVWVINRPDTNVTDVLFSLSPSSPTLPTNYTKKKCIGSIIRSGATILAFYQTGNVFTLSTARFTEQVNPGTSAITLTTGVPTGVKFLANLTASIFISSTNFAIYVSSLDQPDVAPNGLATTPLAAPMTVGAASAAAWYDSSVQVRTNTSGQVRSRSSASGAADRVALITNSWIDPRI